MEEDDEENLYNQDVKTIQKHLETMHNLITRLTPLIRSLGTPEDTVSLRSEIRERKGEIMTLAKLVHRLLIELDKYNTSTFVCVCAHKCYAHTRSCG